MQCRDTLLLAALVVAVIGLSAPSPNANPSNEFAPLFFESGVGDAYGNEAFVRIGSDVQYISTPSGHSRSQRHFSAGASAAPERATYRYVYTFHNPGGHTIRINFSGVDIARSPLLDVLQDFSLQIGPHDTKTVEFSAEAAPNTLFSPVNVALWDSGRERWSFVPFGTAPLYLPSRLSVH